ncbi:uncharacterized protein LOC119111712 [Pollicipes pollicipes]|uniref:uncharacterized protein LOC119111712 n=1 Tax=Pollicipes pollicipes TaxID=41117 RepID=UPI0018850FA9|nr:uncharacterized protein LOC119111712 [Pollicipes pollicipes]
MGEFQMHPAGGSKRHMSVGSSAKMRNDAKAVVKSAKISSTNKVSKGETIYQTVGKAGSHVTEDLGSLTSAEANKENAVTPRRKKMPSPSVFGYDIDDINNFLSQATARTPANIPMVVTSRTELYVLAPAATPEDPTVPIRLGLVVNALFKHRQWLYVQTPHNQEGYLAYSACTPLGIIPRGAPTGPWEDADEAPPRHFPGLDRARGRQRARSQSTGREAARRVRSRPRRDQSAPGCERPLAPPPDALDRSRPSAFHPLRPCSPPTARSLGALRRAEVAPPRGQMVAPRSNNKAVIWDGFVSCGRNTLTVKRGDIVILLNTSVGDWFWVKDAVGREGYIPSACVGSGPN